MKLIAAAIEGAEEGATPADEGAGSPTAVATGETPAADPTSAGGGRRDGNEARASSRTTGRRARAGGQQPELEWPGGIVVEVIDPFRPDQEERYASRLRIDSGVLDPWSSARLAYLTETIDPWGGRYRIGPVATSEVIDPFSPSARLNVGLLDPWLSAEAREPGAGLSRPRPFVP